MKRINHLINFDFTGMLLRNQGRLLFASFERMVRAVGNRSVRHWRKVLGYFVRALFRLYRANGIAGVVLYLKACQLCLMQANVGHRVSNPRSLGAAIARTRSGIPRIIPKVHRKRIREGDILCLRIWLSLFSVYRVLEFPGILKLKTITEPSSFVWKERFDFPTILSFILALPGNSHIKRCVDSLSDFSNLSSKNLPWLRSDLEARPFLIAKSGPLRGQSTSPRGVLMTAWLWFRADYVTWRAITDWFQLTGNDAMAMFMMLSNKTVQHALPQSARDAWIGDTSLGKLSVKEEPAGKLRVFAIVDCWTQWLFKPLHKIVQQTLRCIPQDGTFDQLKPIKELIARKGSLSPCWSFDLSAATDRLPLELQIALLSPYLGLELARAWGVMLGGRSYKLPSRSYSHKVPKPVPLITGHRASAVKYAVGQPMGALSSWVMLAFTHHLIVQVSAWLVYGYSAGWFKDYAILGDDIVIADERVAFRYLEIMTVELGVEINVNKSLISEKSLSLEFAKRYFVAGQDCSPLSFKELREASRNFSVLKEMKNKYNLSLGTLLFLLGFPAHKARLLNKHWSDLIDFKCQSLFSIFIAKVFTDEIGSVLDPATLNEYRWSLIKRAHALKDAWTRPYLFKPIVSEVPTSKKSFGPDFITESKTRGAVYVTGLTGGLGTLWDYFGLRNAPAPAARKEWGWTKMAHEVLYAQKDLWYLTKIELLLQQLESDAVLDWVTLTTLDDDLSSIPKDPGDIVNRAEEVEPKSFAQQISSLRKWFSQYGKVVTVSDVPDLLSGPEG